jgi:carbamate kinase
MTRVVVALGGNALLRRGDTGSIDNQRRNLVVAARALVELEAAGHELVVTHGNGPQVGYLAIEADAAADIVPPPPLDVLVAESQGQIGYLLSRALDDAEVERGRRRPTAVVLTQVVVDPRDPAFLHPTKPVGPVYDRDTAERLAAEHSWTIAPDGAGWRRVVPSPQPTELLEATTIRALTDDGVLVIASGGGGIPVARADGTYIGVEAVVDKDLAAVVLARAVDADALLLLTDVDAAYRGWGTAASRRIARLSPATARRELRRGTFADGSMGPKILAAVEFVSGGGRLAAIGALEDAAALLEGSIGTRIELRAA